MDSNEPALLAVIAKQLRELRDAFKNLSKQVGPAGKDGRNGADGRDGKDGARGADGKDGARGPAGPRGPRGEPGPAGKDGERGPAPDHQWKSTKLRFQKPDGTWGKYVDLKGDRGAAGASGGGWPSGGQGGSLDPESFPLVDTLEPLDEMIVIRAGEFVRVRVALQAGEIPANAVTVNGEAVTVNGQFVVVTP